jgi:hypothetical protein
MVERIFWLQSGGKCFKFKVVLLEIIFYGLQTVAGLEINDCVGITVVFAEV